MFDRFNVLNNTNDSDPSSSSNQFLFLITIALGMYAIARIAESHNQLNYENRSTRIIAGLLLFMTRLFHTKNDDDVEISNTKKKLITAGPHRTGWEALVVASKLKGEPPRFFATDAFNVIPGISQFMKTFKAIPIKYNKKKSEDGRSANEDALDLASKVLDENGCVALFPQGNFSRIKEKPPIVYSGAAKLALKNNIPIQIMRLDGFWCLENPCIPLVIRNNTYYRALFSAFHMNNVRVTLCPEINFHLQPENMHLSEQEKIEEICAQLYAYYHQTNELTPDQVHAIEKEICDGSHLRIWKKAKEEYSEAKPNNIKNEKIITTRNNNNDENHHSNIDRSPG